MRADAVDLIKILILEIIHDDNDHVMNDSPHKLPSGRYIVPEERFVPQAFNLSFTKTDTADTVDFFETYYSS